jgi:glycosyltransferase involved in cell wall biosynthesis
VTTVHVVVPDGIDDPAQPSGGNGYDRRVCQELAALGWTVHEQPVPGSWPQHDAASLAALAGVIASLPDRAVVLVDGLIASAAPEVLVPAAARLRIVVLMHMPLGHAGPGAETLEVRARERSVLSAAAAVVATSAWTRHLLLDRYALRPAQIHVAEPGVDPAERAPGTTAGGELLCVAAVTPLKGHDVLLAALAAIAELSWHCLCVGGLTRDPPFVDRLERGASEAGIGGRMVLAGPRTGADLDASYAAADVLVLASRAETYGMVVTEALARGLPVITTTAGGLPATLGRGTDGSRPGLLVPPDDAEALAGALRRWLGDADLRRRLRTVADERRGTLPGWSATALRISEVLEEVAA